MTDQLPHPTALTRPRNAVNDDFFSVTQTRCVDRRWHFQVGVHRASKAGPGGEAPPEGQEIQSLGLFQRESPPADVEILGMALGIEIDPADWLEEFLRLHGMEVVSRRPVRMLAGVVGDVVARWSAEGGSFAGRFFATKWGPRLFLLWGRTGLASYPELAEDFFVSVMTFRVLDDSLGLFAEKVRTVAGGEPISWKAMVPGSWKVEPENAREGVGAFQASLISPAEEGGAAQQELLGKLSFAVVSRAKATKAREVARKYFDALRDLDIDLESTALVEEEASAPYEQSWLLVSPFNRKGGTGEVRCRILQHPRAWVVAGVVGPNREADVAAWMQCKRALDIAALALELRP